MQKFQKSKTHIDENLYESAKYNVQKLVKIKKRDFYQVKLTENIGKPKELWKTLKSLGLPSKKSHESKICLKGNDSIKFDDAENASIFKDFFSKLADDLVQN